MCRSDMADTTAAATYGSYLKIDELLSLQQPRSEGPEHDEMLFIIIHQVYELWFKELLHEFDRVVALLDRRRAAPRAAHAEADPDDPQGDGRAARHPRDDDAAGVSAASAQRLEAASGFQSDQFRQIEFLLGAKSEPAIARFPEGSRARAGARAPVSRADAVGRVPALPVARGLRGAGRRSWRATSPRRSSRRPRSSRFSSTSTARDPKNAELCERLVDLDEGLQEWRYRHVKMVERTIGDCKRGTGGSTGAAYLARARVGHGPSFPDSVGDPRRSQGSRLNAVSRRTTRGSASPSGCC